MDDEHEHFDDPQLKAVLKRTHGGHRASDALRARITAIIAQETMHPVRPRVRWMISRLPLAIAALVLIAIGTLGVRAYLQHRHEQQEYEEYVALNQPLFDAMAAAHDANEMTPPPSGATPSDISRSLGKTLDRPVPVVDLSTAGWSLQSADVTTVAESRAARWRLAKGSQHISIFSFPTSALKEADELPSYELIAQKHAIAGFVGKDGLLCVVCDPSMSLDEARHLLGQLKKSNS